MKKTAQKKAQISKKQILTTKKGEVRELSKNTIRKMRHANEVLPKKLLKTIAERKVGQRGPQKKPTKISVTLRYSPEVIEYFKSSGDGWQTKMDDALKAWIKKNHHAA